MNRRTMTAAKERLPRHVDCPRLLAAEPYQATISEVSQNARREDRESKQPVLKPEVVRRENNSGIRELREKQLAASQAIEILAVPLRTPSNVPRLSR